MGISTIRVIDPETGVISRLENGNLVAVTEDLETIPNTPCILDWPKIRELLDL